ncbi:flavodoxin domain-containing protein [Microbacterium sp. CJ77]|jgi:menaquinone-dependent protoporphyrinogen oxidase|uniref:flavodoxin domain-containing protein n=1 Tax=Microbacterium sp. CJ77 TaxID=2079201 RepID=UPI000CD83FBD|nr:flavodoxin domain-containing protein [Microbacterium sp. CJ77]
MPVLVAYASRHGSTAGIAERIAEVLTDAGVPAEARPVSRIDDLDEYDAFVIGAAAYITHWLKDAMSFVEHHRHLLAARPVWLFSSGPLGSESIGADGKDPRESTRPKEFDELADLLHPRDQKVFFGAWDPDAPPVGMAERMMKLAPAAAKSLPAGDFRDWNDIDAWATQIARELAAPTRA